MSISISNEFNSFDQRAIIKVCGVGGGGGNAVGRMIEAGLSDVEFITINTDAQALKTSPAGTRLQIGTEVTGGLGSGAKPDVGEEAAKEDEERIGEVLQGADMVFLTAGLGGGTGTGASPIIADIARHSGALTVAIVTLPFSFEGPERMAHAKRGLEALEDKVDTLIVVPNDRVASLSQNDTSFLNAFRQADEVLHNGVRAIAELITVPGLINLDFADVRTIMQARGRALMGIGVAEGEDRALRAAREAIICPLLEQSSITGAKGVIVNVTGGCEIGMREIQEAVTAVQKAAHPDANIIFGAVVDEEERPELQVTVIAAGFPTEASQVEGDESEAPSMSASGAGGGRGPSVYQFPGSFSGDGNGAPETPDLAPPDPAEAFETAEPATPEVQYLFSSDELNGAPEEPAAEEMAGPEIEEEEEDLSLPTFMRRRRRNAQ